MPYMLFAQDLGMLIDVEVAQWAFAGTSRYPVSKPSLEEIEEARI